MVGTFEWRNNVYEQLTSLYFEINPLLATFVPCWQSEIELIISVKLIDCFIQLWNASNDDKVGPLFENKYASMYGIPITTIHPLLIEAFSLIGRNVFEIHS